MGAYDVWKVFCVQELEYQTVYLARGSSAPSTCPNDVSHSVSDVYIEDEATTLPGVAALKLERFVGTTRYADFREINYKTALSTRLHPTISTIFRGEVRRVEYHATNALNDLVISEDILYARDPSSGLATHQTKTVTWYLEDGTPHPLNKVREKYYSNLEKMREGNKRRSNVIDNIALIIVGLVSVTEGVSQAMATGYGEAFTEAYNTEVSNYIRVGAQQISTAVTADTAFAWLDNDLVPVGYPAGATIRSVILSELQEILA